MRYFGLMNEDDMALKRLILTTPQEAPGVISMNHGLDDKKEDSGGDRRRCKGGGKVRLVAILSPFHRHNAIFGDLFYFFFHAKKNS